MVKDSVKWQTWSCFSDWSGFNLSPLQVTTCEETIPEKAANGSLRKSIWNLRTLTRPLDFN